MADDISMKLENLRVLRDKLTWLDLQREEAEEAFVLALRQFRKESGLGLRDAAKILSISPSYLCDIELGRRRVSGEMLLKFKALIAQQNAQQ